MWDVISHREAGRKLAGRDGLAREA
jgi:hypothetical protein